MLRTLYNDPDRYVETYFGRFGARIYFAGDGARRDADGYFWITGRVDDVINVSGHRLSTAEIESALVSHPAVAEAAVIATADDLTGQAIVAYVTVVLVSYPRRGSRRSCASTSAARSASWPGRAGSSGLTTCPRPGPGRSCAGSCATSQTAGSSVMSPPCVMPPSLPSCSRAPPLAEPVRLGAP